MLNTFSTGPEATNPSGNTGWDPHTADLTVFAGRRVRLMFREVIPEAFTGPGQLELDAVSLTTAVPDTYSVTLKAGERVSVGVEGQTIATHPVPGVAVDLLDASGNRIASGITGSTNFGQVINNYLVGTTGTYYLRVISPTPARYGLVITRDAALDTEPNDSFATAQPLGDRGALGAITPGSTITPEAVPNVLSGIAGNSAYSLSGASRRFQQIFSRSEFSGPAAIDFIKFRREFGVPFTGSGNMRISLGYAATTVANPSPVFAENIGDDFVTVYDGPVTLNSSGTGSPNPFDVVFDVMDLFTYDPSRGDLLLDIQGFGAVTFPSGAAGSLDASGFGQQSVTNSVRGLIGDPNATSGLVGSFGPGSPAWGLIAQFDLLPPQTDDWFTVDVSDTANPLQFHTATPGDGAGEFANTLNPKIELYDPSGALVASGVVGSDGRNETLTYTPLTTGTYRVRILGEDGTRGEYFLARNTAPVAGPVLGPTPTPEVRGQSLHFSSLFTDADERDTHEVQWDFGDGTVTAFEPASAASLAPSHSYTDTGTYTVTFRVRDSGGAVSSSSTTLTVQAVARQANPFDPGTTDLAAGGTTGGAGDDLMIGGSTTFDEDEIALNAVQLEWTSSRDGDTRMANLSGTGTGPRLNGTVYLTPGTVIDDGDLDRLTGAAGFDWLWLGNGDR